ncbi:MAG TPA: helix-turn-helix transcriptional regulator, partial [Dehalococcoidia bacterium]
QLNAAGFDDLMADIGSIPEPKDASTLIREMVSKSLLLAYEGGWDEVLTTAEGWMGHIRLAGKFQAATAQVVWGEACFWLGDAAGAEDAMRSALKSLESEETLGAMHLARVLLTRGLRREAELLVQKYAAVILSSARGSAGRALLAELAVRLDDADLCRRLIEAMRADTVPMAVGYVPISLTRVRAGLLGATGRWQESFDLFERALEELGAAGAHWEQVMASLDYADARLRRGRRGDDIKAMALRAAALSLMRQHDLPTVMVAERLEVPTSAKGARFGLTGRELEVLQLVAQGLKNPEIADQLGISKKTADRHVQNIFMKMSVSGRTEAVVLAFKERLIEGVN